MNKKAQTVVNNQKTISSDTSYPFSDLPAHTVEIGKNTKTGQTIYVLKLKDRVSTEDYKAIAGSVKERTGGYYSRFAGGFIVPKEVYDGYRAFTNEGVAQTKETGNSESDEWNEIDSSSLREQLAERGIVNGEIVDPKKLDSDPFIQRVMSDVEHTSGETSEQSKEPDPDEIPSNSFTSKELFKAGDTVYLDNTAFEVINVNRYNVELRDPTLSYPISRVESKKRLMQLMQNDERNRSIIDRMEAMNDFQKEESDSIVSSDADKRSAMVAGVVVEHLNKGKRITSKELFQLADQAFDGSMANGDYTVKDAYDALELGVNRYILSLPTEDVTLESMEQLMSLLPTQSKRTEEQESYQQFSTPPTLAYLAAYAANIRSNDVLLEPSAGIGGLAVFGKLYGAEVHVNELDARRLAVPYKFGT